MTPVSLPYFAEEENWEFLNYADILDLVTVTAAKDSLD